MSHKELRVIPLGGLGEIGMNCMVLEWGDEMVLMDCGIQFPNAYFAGVDLLTPDFEYLRSRWQKLHGVVVTHGHDDHIGAIPFLAQEVDVDVYCTNFPKGLILQKLSEYPANREVNFHLIKPGKAFSLGSFKFHPIRVRHSIIECLAFAIETPVGTLIHTGDFKHDSNEMGGEKFGFEEFSEWGRRGVHLLFSDSTNAEKDGHTLSEIDITHTFKNVFARQRGRIIIALFASNIRRIENLLWLAKKLKKKVAFSGRSMHAYTRLAQEQSSLNIPEDTLVLLENIHEYSDDHIIILATGSQAEPGSALIRIAQGTHKDIQIRNGDQVILSSRFIPGNERAITGMIDQLYRMGSEVTYESIESIHVSGHGFQEELLMMIRACKPRYFVPVHGEYRHLARHAQLAKIAGISPKNIFVVEDGQTLELDAKELRLAEKRELHKTAVVDGMVLEGSAQIFTQRTNLSRTGVVFAVLIRDAKSLKLATKPKICCSGLLFKKGDAIDFILGEATKLLEQLHARTTRRGDLNEFIRVELRRFFKKRLSYKPVVIPLLLEV